MQEKRLQNNLNLFADVQKQAVQNLEFEISLQREKENEEKLMSDIVNAYATSYFLPF